MIEPKTTLRQRALLHLARVAQIGWLASCSLLLVQAQAPTENPQNHCLPTQDPKIIKTREKELRATAAKLLGALREGDADAFLELVHDRYFSVGEDGENYTSAQLREALRTKTEIYCYLFDSSCIPADAIMIPGRTAKVFSFKEMARRPGVRVKDVEVVSGEGLEASGCTAYVHFLWVAVRGERLPVNVSSFTFMYEGGQWKTVGFSEPPVVDVGPKGCGAENLEGSPRRQA